MPLNWIGELWILKLWPLDQAMSLSLVNLGLDFTRQDLTNRPPVSSSHFQFASLLLAKEEAKPNTFKRFG